MPGIAPHKILLTTVANNLQVAPLIHINKLETLCSQENLNLIYTEPAIDLFVVSVLYAVFNSRIS